MSAPTALPSEIRLLVVCSRAHLDAATAVELKALVRRGLDWELVLKQARRHGVIPLLHRHLANLGAPDSVRTELGTYARKNAVHNLMLARELLRLLEGLKAAGVSAVPYKGPVLASTAYGDLTLRSFQDLDIIVRPCDFEPALGALRSSGYDLIQSAEGRFHATLQHLETGVLVELHRDVVRRNLFPTGLELGAMWNTLTQVELLGSKVPSFAPEDTLLLLCLHGAKHEWQGLIWLCDVAEHLRAHPSLDWEKVLQQANRARVTRVLLLGLLLAEQIVGVQLPEMVWRSVNADPRLPGLAKEIISRLHEDQGLLQRATLPYRLRAGMRSQFRDKLPVYLSFGVRLLRPNEQDKRCVALPKSLAAGYYLFRPLRLFWNGVVSSTYLKMSNDGDADRRGRR